MVSTHDDDIARMMNDDIEEPMEKAQDDEPEEEIKVRNNGGDNKRL
jgi:hypothetical protein